MPKVTKVNGSLQTLDTFNFYDTKNFLKKKFLQGNTIMVFKEEYANAYDDLYQDKDYEKECDYIEALFKQFNYKPETILDLGCGTGDMP